MESRKHLAAEKKRCNSHNCAQAVVCTYCDLVDLPEQTALDIAGAYGTGMGNMEGTCGALVGAGMILGLHTKDRNLSRARMKNLMEKFSSGTEPPGAGSLRVSEPGRSFVTARTALRTHRSSWKNTSRSKIPAI